MIEPGYYRYKGKTWARYDEIVNPGDLGYAVWDSEEQHVAVLIKGHHFTYNDLEEFEQEFEPAPEGAAEYHKNVLQLLAEIEESNVQYKDLSTKLIDFNPHIEDSGEVASTALTPTEKQPAQLKKKVAEIRNVLAKTKKSLASKKKKLDLMVKDMKTSLEVKAASLNAMVKKAEEAIWTINLYLGKEEEIHRLVQGESAPKGEKIRIRQGILYMDEECAAAAESGGIDVRSIEEFDTWIVKPKNLQRVLPEPKGIVAFHIRREKKEYGDAWTNTSMNKANLSNTYFLIRNGENLYRIYADIVLDEHLFPTEQEYKELFEDSEFDWDTRKSKKKVLRPGSSGYMSAMKKMEAKQRHYLRVLLILQGLLDRTAVFKPLPFGRINICNYAEYYEFLEFIRDREKVLGSIMPDFRDWQKELNSKLEIGHRIIGSFDSYSVSLRPNREYDEGRLHPRHAASPDSLILHTIERREDDAFVFLYARNEQVYTAWSYHDAKNRASCRVYTYDDFILNFDLAKVSDMEFYINSRLDRHHYLSMLPLLKKAIQLKKQEKKDEEPFRKLLISQIVKTHSTTIQEAEKHVDDLIYWWKFKNRTHRALTSDDQKALRMIIKEYGHRVKREAERKHVEKFQSKIIETIQNQKERPVMIAHKKENFYVALIPHNKMNYWVKEQLWLHNRKTDKITLKEEKEWKLVDNRHKRWSILHAEPRWSEWEINPQKAKILTDPEIEEAVKWGISKIKAQADNARTRRKEESSVERGWWNRSETHLREIRDDVLKVYLDPETFNPVIWYCEYGPIFPTELLISNTIDSAETRYQPIRFKRKRNSLTFYISGGWSGSLNDEKYILLEEKPKALAKLEKEKQRASELEKEARKQMARYEYLGELIEQLVIDQKEQEAYDEFIAEHGDPELWEDEKKQLNFKGPHQHSIRRLVYLFAERDIDIIGKTLGELITQAKDAGWLKEKEDNFYHRSYDYEFDLWPADFVIPEKPEEDVEEEENFDKDEE